MNCYAFNNINQKGFTLLEILITLMILSIGLLGMAEMQVVAIRANCTSKNFTSATILAEGKIENLKANGFLSLSNGTTTETNIDETGASGGIFTRVTTTTNYASSLYMKQITVTVSWTEMSKAYSISANTVLSKTVDY